MASAKDLRRRISSVKSTQQITKAMKMVSAAKLRRAQESVAQARPYANKMQDMVYELSSREESIHPLQEKRDAKKVGVLLITSDKGLCGGFNSNLCKKAETFYKENKDRYGEISFLCAGKKGKDFISLRSFPLKKFYSDAFKNISPEKSYNFTMGVADYFLSKEIDELYMISAEFKTALSQKFLLEKILPISPSKAQKNKTEEVKKEKNSNESYFSYEPSKKGILERLLPMYLTTKVHLAFLESSASEHGARMAAMDSATTNAGEVIRKLTLLYNSIRQAGITKELLEITSGAEVL